MAPISIGYSAHSVFSVRKEAALSSDISIEPRAAGS